MTMNKTQTKATKNGVSKLIAQHRLGWNLPPEEGRGSYIGGTGAYAECVERWKEHGWTVERQPNPAYSERPLFSFA